MLRRGAQHIVRRCGRAQQAAWGARETGEVRRGLTAEAVPSGDAPDAAHAPATEAEQRSEPVAAPPPTHAVFKVCNVARLALAEELAAVLHTAGLPPLDPAADLRLSYDQHMRPRSWFVRVPFAEAEAWVRTANAALPNHVFGGRVLRLEPRSNITFLPDVPPLLAGFTQRAVCVSGMSDGTTSFDVEHFFNDFSLIPAEPVKLMRRHGSDTPVGRTLAAIVRFTHTLEAQRAVRERHRDLLNMAQVDVVFLQ